MPIYEYECLVCGNQFEQLVFNLSLPINCPSCKQQKVHKKPSLFSSPSSSKTGSYSSSAAGSCAACTSKNCSSCG